MKHIHMLCNAHIDPVWLWRWQEGAAETLSTFRCAADFCDEFDGFVFNHNESLLYKLVEENEPKLFERIKTHVKNGKWKIIGGWYNQPDCNLPAGESFVRQILCGKNYFLEKFGVEPETALNFDSFGHSRGLVQILKKSGYKNYILSRVLTPGDYKWVGFDGSEIIAHKSFEGYGSYTGDVPDKIERFIREHKDDLGDHSMILWGVGDHGGGPSRRDIADVDAKAKELKKRGIHVIHSSPDAYFEHLDIQTLPPLEESIRPFGLGCYTTMSNIKKAYRQLENSLYMTEKMAAHANLACDMPYDKQAIEQAAEDLMFCQFHDILPGTMIEAGEKDCLNRMGRGIAALDDLQMKVFFALSAGQEKARENEIPILVYNPHPYPVETDIACEYQLANQNWTLGEFTAGEVYQNGKKIPSQFEKEDSNMNLDWRKKVVFHAELAPTSMNRFDCKLEIRNDRKIWDIDCFEERWSLDNGQMQITFDPETGLIDSYCVGGKPYLFKHSGKLLVIQDSEHSWGGVAEGFFNVVGAFELLSRERAAAFLGYPEEDVKPFKIVEDGDVRTVYEGIYGYNHSFAVVRYTVPKHGTQIKVDVTLHMAEPNKMVKLDFQTIQGELIGQTAFGTEKLPEEGKAAVFQKFSAVRNEEAAFVVINDGTYGGDYDAGAFRQVLLRTCGYSAMILPLLGYPDPEALSESDKKLLDKKRDCMPKNRYMKHIDMGVREFSFAFYGDRNMDLADYHAAVFNEKPAALSFFPTGDGEKCGGFIRLDNRAIVLSAFKKAYDGRGYVIRLYNASEKEETVMLDILPFSVQTEVSFGKFEVKTFRLNVEEKQFVETNLLEREI